MSFVSTNSDFDKFSYLKNDELFIKQSSGYPADSCNRNYGRAFHHYAELYPNHRHPSA